MNFSIALGPENGFAFPSIADARKHAQSLGLPPGTFRILPNKDALDLPACYGVFADRQWRGGVWETIEEAIGHAESLELKSYAIYKEGAIKICDCIYQKENGEVVYDARKE